jgi:hypothetical protein
MPKRPNKVIADYGDYLEIDISTKSHPTAVMLVDKDVWDAHDGSRAYACACGKDKYIHARFCGNRVQIPFHNSVIAKVDGMEIDHIKHGTMQLVDNRRSNLRLATHSQNNMNRSAQSNGIGIPGVVWSKRRGKWQTRITVDGEVKDLGFYDNIDFAVGARKQAEREYFGEFSLK